MSARTSSSSPGTIWRCSSTRLARWMSGVEEGSGGRERGLRVFPKPPVPADPTEEPLHYPPARVHGKADLVRRLAHDLDGDDRRRGRLVAGVASIRKRFGHEGERAPGQAQHRNRSVAILDISGLGFEDQAAPVRVDHDLALAALHLLACIVAARSTTLSGLHALAVEHDGCG